MARLVSRSPWQRIALASFIVTVAASSATASTDTIVQGVVEDALLHPLEGATVVVHDPSGHEIAKAQTTKDGHFTFTVPLGDYTVEASSPGLVSDHQHIQLQSSQVTDVELVLVNTEEIVQIHEDWSVPEPSK